MIGNALRKLDYGLAILAIVGIVIGTILAGIFGGWKMAGIAGLILFLLLDGMTSTFRIFDHNLSKKLRKDIKDAKRDKFSIK